jgi:dienelactone hydrolase
MSTPFFLLARIATLSGVLSAGLAGETLAAHEWHGLYRSDAGRMLVLFPAPGAPEASALLVLDNGCVRVLVALESDEFGFGAALLPIEPFQGTLVLEREANGGVGGVVLSSDDLEGLFQRVALKEEEVAFEHGAVRLAGTLVSPPGAGPFPALVMLHGSEPEPREGNLGMAYLFAAEGLATLVFDKRGVGASSGEEWQASFAEYAGDARAGFALLAARPTIDARRIGFWGHSQGAWVAALAATNTPEAAFAVLECGGALDPVETTLWSYRRFMEARGVLSAQQIEACLAYHRRKFDVLAGRLAPEDLEPFTEAARKEPWFRHVTERIPDGPFWEANVAYDPRPALLGLGHCAVLALFAEHDESTPSEASLRALRSAFESAGHRRATVELVPGANHGFFATEGKRPMAQEFPTLERFAPAYAERLGSWLRTTVVR